MMRDLQKQMVPVSASKRQTRSAKPHYGRATQGNVAIIFALMVPVIFTLVSSTLNLRAAINYENQAHYRAENMLLNTMNEVQVDQLEGALSRNLKTIDEGYAIEGFKKRVHQGKQQVTVTIRVQFEPSFPDPFGTYKKGISFKVAGQYP